MIGFKLNNAGDIEASDGKISLLSTVQEAVRQRLEIKLRTFQNEWFLDTTYGIPYRQQIIGKGLSKPEIDALYIDVINQDPDVQRIVYFNSTYSPLTREYDTSFEVRVADELLRVETLKQTPSEEIEYPVPDGSQLTPSCDAFAVGSYICDLHQIVHCDLPETGEYTWIYNEVAPVAGDDCVRYYTTGYASYGYVKYNCQDTDWSFVKDSSGGITFPSQEVITPEEPLPPVTPPTPIPTPTNAPVITVDLPTTIDAYLGQLALISIQVESQTPVTYQWQVREQGSSFWRDSNVSDTNSYRPIITESLDGRSYRVLVSNKFGTVTSNVGTVKIGIIDYIEVVGGSFLLYFVSANTSESTSKTLDIRLERLSGMSIPSVTAKTTDTSNNIVRDDYIVNLVSDDGVNSRHAFTVTGLQPNKTYIAQFTATSNEVVLIDDVPIKTT